MNESEFLNLSDRIFDQIETALDAGEFDVDLNRNGNVLEIEFEDDSKIVVNRHAANQEIWLAARSGGFHYRLQDGAWKSTRDNSEFFTQLTELIHNQTGATPTF
ncbi:iron donor protein CyaY [Chitinimonas sp. BJB300]|uniref:iron donor protein CyaY n=1 Tax=Chitinimonas sp. BJB300 TaxID=1559339 RepID=UPI000C1075F4|nr:iron donor protein CyaY [Chitinimonas sp. BJB300]PHV09684.1 iron donor protein CyaY [Chitinimonas sp. BJB300]TSJ89664.1 iron donor protein CyaY [Chitinimonas sp. BJB300]